jgi:hypothetical protein
MIDESPATIYSGDTMQKINYFLPFGLFGTTHKKLEKYFIFC